mgnify:CR=1 FL=1
MFISNAEKENLWQTIHVLKSNVKDLEIEIARLKTKSVKLHIPLAKNEEAPWGLKKDGNPRKRPGRKTKSLETFS